MNDHDWLIVIMNGVGFIMFSATVFAAIYWVIGCVG